MMRGSQPEHYSGLDWHETLLVQSLVQKINKLIDKLWLFDKLKVQVCIRNNFGVGVDYDSHDALA